MHSNEKSIKVIGELEVYARELLRQRLSQVTQKQAALFHRIFPGTVPANKLIAAIDLCDRTIAKNEKYPERIKEAK